MTLAKDTQQAPPGCMALAELIHDWRRQNGWSYRKMEAVSALAGGGIAKVTSPLVWKAKKIVKREDFRWNPRQPVFEGLDELSNFLIAFNEGRVHPPLPYRYEKYKNEVVTEADLAGHAGLLDAEGQPLNAEALYGIYMGIRSRPVPCVVDQEVTNNIAPEFGLALEKALFESGLSPIRSADLLLEHYRGDKERLRQVLFNQASFTPKELDDALPAIAYALTKAAGRDWSVDELIDLASTGRLSVASR